MSKLLRKAVNQTAYLKTGIYGNSGSGKTFTSSSIAIGLHKHLKLEKPIAFIDTETGSDWMSPRFKKESIDLLVIKSRAFVDLLEVVKEAEKDCSILIIDSITHFWRELMESYKKKKKLRRITIQHWMDLKQEWGMFSDLFVNSTLHIVMAGRAGDVWETEEDENGVAQMVKTGTKMKVENEMGYEPSLLIEMNIARHSSKPGAGFIQRATIVKDRSDTLNGKSFEMPKFENFLPHVKFLNIGGEHVGVDTNRNSEALIDSDYSQAEQYKKKKIVLEEIGNEMSLQYGSMGENKKRKLEKLEATFGTHSWTKIEAIGLEDLEIGLKLIRHNRVPDEVNSFKDEKDIPFGDPNEKKE